MGLPENIKKYEGVLVREKMSFEVRLAYERFNSMKRRSGVNFTVREFMGWWLHHLKNFSGDIPSISRFDHTKGYSFDNMEIQEMAENSREGILRNKTHLKTAEEFSQPLLMRDWATGSICGEISSIRDAARKFGVSQRLIQFIVRGKYKSSKKVPYRLEYKDGKTDTDVGSDSQGRS